MRHCGEALPPVQGVAHGTNPHIIWKSRLEFKHSASRIASYSQLERSGRVGEANLEPNMATGYADAIQGENKNI